MTSDSDTAAAVTRMPNIPNFRDVGALPAADGRHVRPGRIYRSEAVIAPSDEEAALLQAANIVLVCDLRSGTERDHAPNAWWAAQGVERLDLDILADIRGSPEAWAVMRADPSVAGALRVMNTIYRDLPDAAAPHLALIFARIADGAVPLLVHCTAGKDRTGFVIAMILYALGVREEAIIDEYMLSGGRANLRVVDHTRHMIADRVGPGVGEDAINALIGVDRNYLRTSFDSIAAAYGSVAAYLEQRAGLNAATHAKVLAALLD